MNQEKNNLAYHVGGLLYMPAVQQGIADKIIHKTIPYLTSVAFCLEDSVLDSALSEAEQILCCTFEDLFAGQRADFPLLFIRVRSAEHLLHIWNLLGQSREILTGFILPKFDSSNADAWLSALQNINSESDHTVYAMPILESRAIADLSTRQQELSLIHKALMQNSDLILNVRTGGNDFCNLYGLRRSQEENIYQIAMIRDILADILNCFSGDFIVSAPVWEYFGTQDTLWMQGMKKELALDRLNGFIGKTAIHPTQLPLIWESLKVSEEDYRDACRILNWNESQKAVQKGFGGSRMNELKCHGKWAERIKILGDLYGVNHEKIKPVVSGESQYYYSAK